jgi:hypothetical protein
MMKIIKGNLVLKEDTKFDEGLIVEGNIICESGRWDLIVEGNINARRINAGNINVWNINARRINAGNIDAGNIDAENINAEDIDAGDISAGNIDAENISYYAVCFAYKDIKCKSIKGWRGNSRHFCLDGEIKIKKDEPKKRFCECCGSEINEK